MSRRIFLIGLPGSGKTTMGLDLAVHLSIPFVDLDLDIEKATKSTVTEIFAEKGEPYFRQLEKLHLEKVISQLPEFVLATGGGTPCFFTNMEVMKAAGTTVFIDTPIEEIEQRLSLDTTRPLLKTRTLAELREQRKGWYNQADHTIRTYKEMSQLFS